MKTSEILERMAEYMAEHGHYLRGRDGVTPYAKGRRVCVYMAEGAIHRQIWDNDVPVDPRVDRWICRAANRPEGEFLVEWSDTTPDEEVILTIKLAAEMAREAGE